MKKYISLLVVLFLVSGCSFSFNMKNNEEVKEEKKEEIKEENVNATFYEAAQKIIVNDLLDLVSVGSFGVYNGFDFSNKNKLVVSDLDDTYKYSMAFHNLYGELSLLESFSKNDIMRSYEELFGVKPTLPNIIHIFPCSGYELKGDFYELTANGCGGMSYSAYILDGYDVKDDNIFFNVIFYIVDFKANQTDPVYREIKNKYENQDYSFDISGNRPTDADLEKVKANKDKFIQYRFNFKLNNDHYIFDSVEKIN